MGLIDRAAQHRDPEATGHVDDPTARDQLVTALVNDALVLLAALDVDTITRAGGKPAEAIALLLLVAGQAVEPAEGSDGTEGRWPIARATPPHRVISTVDPDTRHAHKNPGTPPGRVQGTRRRRARHRSDHRSVS